jgi:hypothetical protein
MRYLEYYTICKTVETRGKNNQLNENESTMCLIVTPLYFIMVYNKYGDSYKYINNNLSDFISKCHNIN